MIRPKNECAGKIWDILIYETKGAFLDIEDEKLQSVADQFDVTCNGLVARAARVAEQWTGEHELRLPQLPMDRDQYAIACVQHYCKLVSGGILSLGEFE